MKTLKFTVVAVSLIACVSLNAQLKTDSSGKIIVGELDVTGILKANSFLTNSDMRLKKDIMPLTDCLSKISLLNATSYLLPEIHKKQYGLTAQEVQKIIPEVVEEDKNGMLNIDYMALIPLLIESIKEQTGIITAQSLKIKELENLVIKNSPTDNKPAVQDETVNAFLFQNVPNPFSEETEIRYFLPQNIKQACICIFNMQGKQVMKRDVQTGHNSLFIKRGELIPGVYIYSLVVAGKEIDTKRMILTE